MMSFPVAPSDPAVLRSFRERLQSAGYTERGLQEVFGSTNPEWEGGIFRTIGKSGEERSLSTLATLFFFGAPVEKDRAVKALSPLGLADSVAMKLLSVDGRYVRPNVLLLPHESLILAADPTIARSDYVERVDEASKTMSYLTVRLPVSTALDLGTGCGVQGLIAADHVVKVTSVDVNTRALRFAEFNARLNGIDNIEYLEGSWCEPVAGRKFDLVVANPPYVISPESEYLYRDSGLPGDAICRQVVRDAASHLEEGGYASVLCNWVYEPGKDWSIPLREWVEGSGCDAVLLHYGSDQALAYATRWNRSLLRTDRKRFEKTLSRWLDYYRKLGIEAIAYGAVVLRRRTASSNRVHPVDVPTGPSGQAGDHIQRLFSAHDLLATATDERLLDQAFALVDGHRLDQTLSYHNNQYITQSAVMRLARTIGLEGTIDSRALGVLLACDGKRVLREAIRRASDQLGLEERELTGASIAMIRGLLEQGLIEQVASEA